MRHHGDAVHDPERGRVPAARVREAGAANVQAPVAAAETRIAA